MGAAVQEPEGGGRGAVEVLAVRGWYGGRVCATVAEAFGPQCEAMPARDGMREGACVGERGAAAAAARLVHGWRGGGAWLAYLGEMWVALEEGDARPPGKIRQIAKRVSPCNKTSNLQIQKRTSRGNTVTKTRKNRTSWGGKSTKNCADASIPVSVLRIFFATMYRELSVRYQRAQRAP